MTTIKRTYRSATAEIVRQLSEIAGCSKRTVRRHANKIKNSGTNCECGETWAIKRAMVYKGIVFNAKVGICEKCGE